MSIATRSRQALRLAVVGAAFGLTAACSAGSPGAAPSFATGPADPSPAETAGAPSTQPPASEAPSPATAAKPADPRADGLDVHFGEFAITLEAAAIRPGPVRFVVRNAGELTHGFEMRIDEDRSGSGGGDDRFQIETETFHSGDTIEVRADLPPGRYEIECFVADHDDRGMRTILEVRNDAPLVTPPVAATPGQARITGFAFAPAELEVAVGARVTWTNEDPAPHTVSAVDGSFGSDQLDPGSTFEATMEQAGTFEYLCQIHPTMKGAVVVR